MEEKIMEEMPKSHPDYELVSDAIIGARRQLSAKEIWSEEEINRLVEAACEWSCVTEHFDYVKAKAMVVVSKVVK